MPHTNGLTLSGQDYIDPLAVSASLLLVCEHAVHTHLLSPLSFSCCHLQWK